MNKLSTAHILLICCSTLISGCGPSTYVALLKNSDGSVGKINVSNEKGAVDLDQANTAADLEAPDKKPFNVDQKTLERDFGKALKASPEAPISFLLYFEGGGTQLTTESEALLPKIKQAIAARAEVDISIIGHTDTAGDADANEQLAQERANNINTLLYQYHLPIREITVTSHGEKNLLVKTADNVNEAKNRRVEITIR